MRPLRRNQSKFWVQGEETQVAVFENGKFTGRYTYLQDDPIEHRGYVTFTTGDIYRNPFGDLPNLERMVYTQYPNQLRVGQLLWIDRPTDDDPNYEVVAVNKQWAALKSWNMA